MQENIKEKRLNIKPNRFDDILIGYLYKKGKINEKTYQNYQKKYCKNS